MIHNSSKYVVLQSLSDHDITLRKTLIIPIVLPSGCEALEAPSGDEAQWLHWKRKSALVLLLNSVYIQPAASLDAALQAWESPSCSYPQAEIKLMGGGTGN